jgi:AraC family transcriptional regulator
MRQDVSALGEMQRILEPQLLERYADEAWQGVEVAHWRHGALNDWTRPMREHVFMAYCDTPRRIVRTRDGAPKSSVTDNQSVTILPSGQSAHWSIDPGLDVVHLYVPPERLQAILDRNDNGDAREVQDAVAAPDAVLSQFIRLLHQERAVTCSVDQLYVDTLVELACLHIARRWMNVGSKREQALSIAPAWLRRACDLMLADITQTSSLQALAREANLSPKHFCRAFRDATGAPPHRWLRAERMAIARRMLAETHLPIAEVALKVGYGDQAAFSTAFRIETTSTPAAWRRLHRAG